MIDRRIFLQLTGGAAAGATGLSVSTAANAANVAPSLVHVGEGVDSPLADPLRLLSERLASATNGRLALRSAPEAGEGLPAATADLLVLALEEEFADSEPTSLLLGGLPLGGRVADFAITTWLKGAGGQALWDAAAARNGWKPLMIGEIGGEGAHMWSRSRLVTPSDFRGLRIVTPRAMHGALAAFGAKPMTLAAPEALEALASGAIDAFETSDPNVSLAAAHQLPRGTYWYTDSLSGRSRVISLRVPLERWRELVVADQVIVEAVALETAATLHAVHRAHRPLLVRQIRTLRGARPGHFFVLQALLGKYAHEALAPAMREEKVFASALASMTALVAANAEPDAFA